MDEDDFKEDEEERQTWVEALTQELADDDAPEEDPDYEVGEVTHTFKIRLVPPVHFRRGE